MIDREPPFFIGFAAVPPGLRAFLASFAVSLVVFFAVIAVATGLGQDDPGPGAGYGRHNVTGVLQNVGYPIVHVTKGSDRIPVGSTILMASGGKNGTTSRATPLENQTVEVSGLLLNRGDLNMIQLRGGANGLKAAEVQDGPPVPEAKPLGRWRLAGEICDGKCYAGIMRPGTGLSHRACADLCIDGGIPPVFVSSQPVEGHEFLLVTGPDGEELPEAAQDWIAVLVSAEGEVTQYGELLVFALDPDTLEAVR